jgi:hypothetical protein
MCLSSPLRGKVSGFGDAGCRLAQRADDIGDGVLRAVRLVEEGEEFRGAGQVGDAVEVGDDGPDMSHGEAERLVEMIGERLDLVALAA